ncbi:hypothetical protein GQ54DRAFT_94886 [Martensiomyces pterosporus]|nr:hypothetical protein GQ54DRAFT_94886 [Martensiomyces pterosporus]
MSPSCFCLDCVRSHGYSGIQTLIAICKGILIVLCVDLLVWYHTTPTIRGFGHIQESIWLLTLSLGWQRYLRRSAVISVLLFSM